MRITAIIVYHSQLNKDKVTVSFHAINNKGEKVYKKVFLDGDSNWHEIQTKHSDMIIDNNWLCYPMFIGNDVGYMLMAKENGTIRERSKEENGEVAY